MEDKNPPYIDFNSIFVFSSCSRSRASRNLHLTFHLHHNVCHKLNAEKVKILSMNKAD